jgi:DNA polymerase III epsilon subunit-like protein
MSKKLECICTDIETLSTRSNAVIVSIAAVKFSLLSPETEIFSININPKSSRDLGLHIDPVTVEWWRNQKPEATKAWMSSRVEIADALQQYHDFCGTDKNTIHFANGQNFDFPILDSSFIAVGKQVPWKFWNLRDMRTVYWLGNLDTFNEPRVGVYHDGVDDCLTQIAWLNKAMGITHGK